MKFNREYFAQLSISIAIKAAVHWQSECPRYCTILFHCAVVPAIAVTEELWAVDELLSTQGYLCEISRLSLAGKDPRADEANLGVSIFVSETSDCKRVGPRGTATSNSVLNNTVPRKWACVEAENV